jgi:hypothetical protein
MPGASFGAINVSTGHSPLPAQAGGGFCTPESRVVQSEAFCKEHEIRECYALRLLREASEMTCALECPQV